MWTKLPRNEQGEIDPQAEQEFAAQHPEVFQTRKMAETELMREKMVNGVERLKAQNLAIQNAHTEEEAQQGIDALSKELGVKLPAYNKQWQGDILAGTNEMARQLEQDEIDMARLAAAGKWPEVAQLKKASQDSAQIRRLEIQTAGLNNRVAAARAGLAEAQTRLADAELSGSGAIDPKEARAAAKEQKLIEKEKQKVELMVGSIDETMNVIKEAKKNVGWRTSGIPGKTMGAIPGRYAYDQAERLKTIRANIGFDRLQAMRDASPTGGALGQVAIQELVALQASIASLDIGQTEDQQKENLDAVEEHYENWRRTVTGGSVLTDSAGKDTPKRFSINDLPK